MIGIAIGQDGLVYVADKWSSRAAILSPEGNFQTSFRVQAWKGDSIENKAYLAVDSDKYVYMTDPEGFRVLVFSSTGKPLTVFGRYGIEDYLFGMPNGICLGLDVSIWIADDGNNYGVRYPPLQP